MSFFALKFSAEVRPNPAGFFNTQDVHTLAWVVWHEDGCEVARTWCLVLIFVLRLESSTVYSVAGKYARLSGTLRCGQCEIREGAETLRNFWTPRSLFTSICDFTNLAMPNTSRALCLAPSSQTASMCTCGQLERTFENDDDALSLCLLARRLFAPLREVSSNSSPRATLRCRFTVQIGGLQKCHNDLGQLYIMHPCRHPRPLTNASTTLFITQSSEQNQPRPSPPTLNHARCRTIHSLLSLTSWTRVSTLVLVMEPLTTDSVTATLFRR